MTASTAYPTTTTAAPILARPRPRRLAAWVAGTAAAAVILGSVAVFAARQTDDAPATAVPQGGAFANTDVPAHGGAGRAVDGTGSPIGVPASSVGVSAFDADLVAHGGGGAVWTAAGNRIK